MAIKTIDVPNIPLHSKYPIPEWMYPERYNFSGMLYYNDALVGKPDGKIDFSRFVIMFHGSGAAGIPPADNPEIQSFINDGWVVFASRGYAVYKSSAQPTATGYGYVNRPMYAGYVTKNARWIQSTLEYIYGANSPFKDIVSGVIAPCIIVGQSMGSTAMLAWSGLSGKVGFSPVDMTSKVKAAFVNGATLAATGRLSWNDPSRVISMMTTLFDGVKHLTWASYGYEDKLAPPAFVRRFMRSIDANSPAYFISPGKYGHSWGNLIPEYELARVNDLYLMPTYPFVNVGKPITATSPGVYLIEDAELGKVDIANPLISKQPIDAFSNTNIVKLMTFIACFDLYPSLSSLKVEIKAEDNIKNETNAKVGDVFDMLDAMTLSIMAASTNLANAIARTVGQKVNPTSDGVSVVLTRMNKNAVDFGMSATKYANVHGEWNTNQKTNANEGAILATRFHSYGWLRRVWSQPAVSIKVTGPSERTINYTHQMAPQLRSGKLAGACHAAYGSGYNLVGVANAPGRKELAYSTWGAVNNTDRNNNFDRMIDTIYIEHMENPAKYGIAK